MLFSLNSLISYINPKNTITRVCKYIKGVKGLTQSLFATAKLEEGGTKGGRDGGKREGKESERDNERC